MSAQHTPDLRGFLSEPQRWWSYQRMTMVHACSGPRAGTTTEWLLLHRPERRGMSAQHTPADDLIVYREWPADVIADAVREFNDQMHNGAGVEEISAGLHGLDFLTRRSQIDDDLQARIDGAVIEGRMRIELLSAKEAEDRAVDEQIKLVIKAVGTLHKQVESFQRRFIDPGRFDADEVRELVERRAARSIAKATGSAS